jgi:hypothetical protein
MGQNIKNITLSASFVRASDTAVYAAEDSVSNSTTTPSIITFSAITGQEAAAGKSLLLKTLKVFTDNATVTNGSFRLNLFRESITPVNDNAAFPVLYANRAKKIGYVDFTLTSGGSGSTGAEAFITDVNVLARLAGANVYGALVAKAAYTPASGQNFYFELIAHEIDG